MLALIESLRDLRQEGAAVRVVMFDEPARQGGQQRDLDMASNLAAAAGKSPQAMMIVLTGNLHSRIELGGGRSSEYQPMGHALAAAVGTDRVVALDVADGGGSAWVCSPQCGAIELTGHDGERPWSIDMDEETRPSGHTGWYRVGSITASPPVRAMTAAESAQMLSALGSPTLSTAMEKTPEPTVLIEIAPTQPLSPAEAKFHGTWQGYDFDQTMKTWSFWIDGRTYRAEGGPSEWYEGQVLIDPRQDPAWIDFTIETCSCAYEGGVSTGIFEWDGDTIVIAAPTPDDPRPTALDPAAPDIMRLVRTQGIDMLLDLTKQ
jgi:uncharacterized protein (TIGR03067 family)